jgi:hypothetical protein
MEGLVYPEFGDAVIAGDAQAGERHVAEFARIRESLPEGPNSGEFGYGGKPQVGTLVGGIDFGWRNPFAAIWGVLDRDDVLWITHERYLRETPLSDHGAALPRAVMWYADPAGRTEIEELRRAGLKVRHGDNTIRRGIALVSERIRTGRLKVSPACVNLLAEARLYRYPTPAEREQLGENPIDAHNHALAALRYLVSRIVPAPAPTRQPEPRRAVFDDDESHWTPI